MGYVFEGLFTSSGTGGMWASVAKGAAAQAAATVKAATQAAAAKPTAQPVGIFAIMAAKTTAGPHRTEPGGTAWQTVNGVPTEVKQPDKDWGPIVTDVSKFPPMPASYPPALRNSPRTPLDAYLTSTPRKDNRGGATVAEWDNISWRKRYLWGIPSMDPGNRGAALALMSARERAYLTQDVSHTQAQWNVNKTVGVGIGLALVGTVAAGVIGAVAVGGAATAAGGGAVAAPAAATAVAPVVTTTAPSLATLAGSGSMVGGFGAGIGGASAVVPASLAGAVSTAAAGVATTTTVGTTASGLLTAKTAIGAGTALLGTAAKVAGSKIISDIQAKAAKEAAAAQGAAIIPTSAAQPVPPIVAGPPGVLDQLGLGGVDPKVLLLAGAAALVLLM